MALNPQNPTDTTLSGVLHTLADHDFAGQLRAEAEGDVRCLTCGRSFRPGRTGGSGDELTRLEGVSDPDDQLAVVALRCPWCHTGGVLVLSYGPGATPEEAAVLQHLDRDPARSVTDVPGARHDVGAHRAASEPEPGRPRGSN